MTDIRHIPIETVRLSATATRAEVEQLRVLLGPDVRIEVPCKAAAINELNLDAAKEIADQAARDFGSIVHDLVNEVQRLRSGVVTLNVSFGRGGVTGSPGEVGRQLRALLDAAEALPKKP